jgi:hypothetical protein
VILGRNGAKLAASIVLGAHRRSTRHPFDPFRFDG